MSDFLILPRGITGFFEGRGEAPAGADPKSFARACHAAAQQWSGRVEGFETAEVARNYHRSVLRRRGAAIAVLCNAHFPWIALAEAGDVLPLRFVEDGDLAARIEDAMPCRVMSPSSLEAPPDPESLADLSPAEFEQVRYWRPRRLGDIVFNFWD